jgi:hypothetical protein
MPYASVSAAAPPMWRAEQRRHEAQEGRARCAEAREAEAREVERKADAWTLRAVKRLDADSVKNIVMCMREADEQYVSEHCECARVETRPPEITSVKGSEGQRSRERERRHVVLHPAQ